MASEPNFVNRLYGGDKYLVSFTLNGARQSLGVPLESYLARWRIMVRVRAKGIYDPGRIRPGSLRSP
ncbi:hypothetical protein D9M72_361280 [compost metagenome]